MITCGWHLDDGTRCTRIPFHYGDHETVESVGRVRGFIEGAIAGLLLMLMIFGPALLTGRI